MAAHGDIDIDIAITSVTGWETAPTHIFARQMRPWLQGRGIQLVEVIPPDHDLNIVPPDSNCHPPYYITTPGRKTGRLIRKCTFRWKRLPPRRWIRAEMKRREMTLLPVSVILLMGISADEAHRAQPSDVHYLNYSYPLVDFNMTREDCQQYLTDHHLPIPPRSSCIICPLHSHAQWSEVRQCPQDWQRACALDQRIRHALPDRGQLWLWRKCQPLETFRP